VTNYFAGESHMYFVGEEAIADTDITQVSFVYYLTGFMQSVNKSAGSLVTLLVEFLIPMRQFKSRGDTLGL